MHIFTDNPTGENDEKFVTYFTDTRENNEKIVAKFPFCVVSVPGRVFIISKFCIFYNVIYLSVCQTSCHRCGLCVFIIICLCGLPRSFISFLQIYVVYNYNHFSVCLYVILYMFSFFATKYPQGHVVNTISLKYCLIGRLIYCKYVYNLF